MVSSTQAPACAQVVDDLPDDLAAAGVDAGGRLVEEHDLGSAHEREGEGEALLLAAREGAPGRPPTVLEPDPVEQRLGILGVGVERGEQPEHLEGRMPGYTPPPWSITPIGGVRRSWSATGSRPSTRTRPDGRAAVALEGLDGGVLPAPLGPRRATTWPASARERDAVDGGDRAVAHDEVDDLDRRARGRR